MSAYQPQGCTVALELTTLGLLVLGLGYSCGRRAAGTARVWAWLLVGATIGAALWILNDQPGGVRMLGLIGLTLWAMKAVVAAESAAHGRILGLSAWLRFAAWPGMQPAQFARQRQQPLCGWRTLIRLGLGRLALAVVLLLAARRLAANAAPAWQVMAVALPALSLLLHFGLFNLSAGLWRYAGVPCQRLFRSPLRSTSLAEFWGRRWNRAFTEMTRLAVYEPLRRHTNRRVALLATFAFSGLLHELAISVPARQGYGGPTAYFAVHALLVCGEQTPQMRSWLTAHRLLARAWTIFWLVVPLPLLFHTPFLRGMVWPLIVDAR